MAVLYFLNKLKTRLSSDENNLEDLKFVARELSSFYKTNQISEPENLSPKEIYEELRLLPIDPDYTDQTREVKLHELKTKLLSIISKITESTKLNKTPVVEPRRNVLKRVGESSLEIMFELVNFLKFSAKGIGKPGVRKAFNFALIFFIGLAVLYVIKLIAQKQEPPAADHKIITETLIKDYNNKLEFYNQKSGSLKRKIQKELSGNPKRQLEAETELITVKRKIDSLNAVILPDLELIKNKPIDPSRRSRLNAYIQILKNF